MTLEHRKLLTIVTEASLEHELVREIERLGAHGYTVTDSRGQGSRGVRNAAWYLSANIRIEVICTTDTAHTIAAVLRDRYYDNYAMILFIGDVAVLRPEKF